MKKLECIMCILVFSFFSAEINELKDEKTRMHNVPPGSHPLSSLRLFKGFMRLLKQPYKGFSKALIRHFKGP